MSSNFVVAGAGTIGAWIIEELLKYKASGAVNTLKVISRTETIKSKNPEWFAKGVEFAQADYTDEAALTSHLRGADVVFGTIGSHVLDQQKILGRAAKTAGVKLFVPSEFGIDTESATEGVFLAKKNLSEFLKEIDLPYVKIFNGLFIDYCVTPKFGWNFDEGKVVISGSGDSPMSFTHRSDVVRYIAYVFTHTPPSELAWKILRIQSELSSYNKIVTDYEAKTGKKLEVTRISREVLAERASKGDISAFLFHKWDVSGGTAGTPLTTDLYPNWNPKSVVDALTEQSFA